MILRRFMQHVREQNWFAVGLDVIVVIVGIFLGLQVQAWYEDQKERALENIYINQLHSELIEAEREFLFFLAPRIEMREKLIEVLEYFADRRDVSSLNNINCYSVYSSHIYNSRIISIPSLTELISSGQISIIKNAELRQTISQYEQGINVLATLNMGVGNEVLVISRKYPEYIVLDPEMRMVNNFENLNHQCDFEAMKKNDSFKNDLIDNSTRLHSYTEVVERQINNHRTAHAVVDDILGISHEEGAS